MRQTSSYHMKLIKSVKSGQLATIKAQWYELTHKKKRISYFALQYLAGKRCCLL